MAFDSGGTLQGPPNFAAILNAAANLGKMTEGFGSSLGDAYQSGKDFQYKQRQQNLFANGAPTTGGQPNGPLDYTAMLRQMIQAGGAPVAGQMMPLLQKQPFLDAALNDYRNETGQGQPQNAGPATSTAAAGPANITGNYGNGQPKVPADTSAPDTLNSLAAEHHVDLDAFLRKFPDLRSVLNRDLSPGLAQSVTDRMAYFNKSSGTEETPTGIGGSSPISPAPTSASGAGGFSDRFSAAYGSGGAATNTGGQPLRGTVTPDKIQDRMVQNAPPPQFGGAANMVPKGADPLSYANALKKRAEALRRQSNTQGIIGIPTKAKEDQAAALDKQADAILEQLGKAGELTPEQKNVGSGATERAGQIAADTKYYDSLHRGLAGSGIIAAQQKQNIDILRQVAASPSFAPGAGSHLWLNWQRMAASLGINPRSAAPREVFNQVAARILADQFSGMKSLASETGETGARIFKPMLDIEEKANLTSDDTLEGIKAKLDLLDKTGDLQMRWADKADDYKLKHGRLDAAFDRDLRADIASWHIVNAAEGGALLAPQAPRLETREQAVQWARSKGLKPGDPMLLSNGQLKAAP